jgi:FkbM family methyltransferase
MIDTIEAPKISKRYQLQNTKLKDSHYLKCNGYVFYYNNKTSAEQTLDEVFYDKDYAFNTSKKSPVIIDCGSNIGAATVFFKSLYPTVKILCFEPDPNEWQMLNKNIQANQLGDINTINAAVSGKEGTIDFFGEFDVEAPDARGNSIISTWGMQRVTSTVKKVKAVKLSSYISSEVDFLKLDIEGAEQQVLQELGDKLHYVNEINMKVHVADGLNEVNSLENIIELLGEYNFSCKVEYINIDVLPEAILDWVIEKQPQLIHLRAYRKR